MLECIWKLQCFISFGRHSLGCSLFILICSRFIPKEIIRCFYFVKILSTVRLKATSDGIKCSVDADLRKQLRSQYIRWRSNRLILIKLCDDKTIIKQYKNINQMHLYYKNIMLFVSEQSIYLENRFPLHLMQQTTNKDHKVSCTISKRPTKTWSSQTYKSLLALDEKRHLQRPSLLSKLSGNWVAQMFCCGHLRSTGFKGMHSFDVLFLLTEKCRVTFCLLWLSCRLSVEVFSRTKTPSSSQL